MHEVLVIGAGAMGCLFAGRMREAGASVTLVDIDPERIALLDRDGIDLTDHRGRRRIAVPVVTAAEIRSSPDLILMFVKAMHSRAAAQSVAHLATSRCHALTLQNGIGNGEVLAEVFGVDRTLLGVTDQPADLHGPTEVEARAQGRVWLGALAEAGTDAAGVTTALLLRAGFDAECVGDPLAAVWEKAAFNAALNAVGAITGLPNGGIDTPEGRRIAAAVVDEALAVATAHGIAIDAQAVGTKIDHALAAHREHKASMLQDRIARRPTEIDAINGAIVRSGEAAGVATPVNATLADLMRLIERSYRGSLAGT